MMTFLINIFLWLVEGLLKHQSSYVNNKLAAVSHQIKVSEKSKGKLVVECDEMWSLIISSF
jgi:hypothetical protein